MCIGRDSKVCFCVSVCVWKRINMGPKLLPAMSNARCSLLRERARERDSDFALSQHSTVMDMLLYRNKIRILHPPPQLVGFLLLPATAGFSPRFGRLVCVCGGVFRLQYLIKLHILTFLLVFLYVFVFWL